MEKKIFNVLFQILLFFIFLKIKNEKLFMLLLLENYRMIRNIQLRLYGNFDVRVTSYMEKCYYFY